MAYVPVPPERLFFKCPECSVTLSLESHLAGVTGPCPTCGSSVTSPSLQPTLSERASIRSGSFRKGASRCRKGRISADSGIDQSHLERKETAKTLLVILLFLLAFCACLLVTWFMKDWIRR